ncbi:MAG: Gfo/Idh/MocA family oxidoreductase [Clostridiaceae bacterium]|nr:Gfo/Idh/MocA family oxidoreductase [Clostridiaceae bacterium]
MNQHNNQPKRVAVIGCGRVAESHLRAIRHLRGRLVLCGLADTDTTRATTLWEQSGIRLEKEGTAPGIYADYRTMLEAEHPDLVAITTPSGTHAAMGIDCMRAGAHLVMEKPMTMSLGEADQLLAVAGETGRRIAVGHKFRYVPPMRALHAALSAGLIGDLLQGRVHVRWGHDQAYYEQAAWRGTWRMDGGALMNQSIHGLDLLLWLMDSPVRRATGLIARRAHRMEAEDLGCAVLELQSGALCLVEGTTNTSPQRQEAKIALTGTRGTVTAGIRAGRPSLSIRDERGKDRTGRFLARILRDHAQRHRLGELAHIASPHTLLYADFVDGWAEGRPPLADGASGRAAVEAVLAVYRSALEDRPVELPLQGFTLDQMEGFFD